MVDPLEIEWVIRMETPRKDSFIIPYNGSMWEILSFYIYFTFLYVSFFIILLFFSVMENIILYRPLLDL